MTKAATTKAATTKADTTKADTTKADTTRTGSDQGAGADLVADRLVLVPMSLELMETLLRGQRHAAQQMVRYRIPDTGCLAGGH